MNKIKLQKLVKTFRKAIINCDKKILPPTLKNFPYGACGDASLLLARYLIKNNIYPLEYVSGEMISDSSTHAWLKIDDLFIDITVDQFEEMEKDHIISKNESWYAQFDIVEKYIANVNYNCIEDDKSTKNMLDRAYKNITSCL